MVFILVKNSIHCVELQHCKNLFNIIYAGFCQCFQVKLAQIKNDFGCNIQNSTNLTFSWFVITQCKLSCFLGLDTVVSEQE